MRIGRTFLLVAALATLTACGKALGADFDDVSDACSVEGERRCADGLLCQSGKWVTDPGTRSCQGQDVVGCSGDSLEVIESCTGPCDHGECRSVVQLAVGYQNGCALLDDGSVWCWGDNDHGTLGRETFTPFSSTPAPVTGVFGGVTIALGDRFGCALLDTGRVTCWGDNGAGQLGGGGGLWRTQALEIESLHDVEELFAARDTACARRSDGTLACWGRAEYPCMQGSSDGWAAFYPVPLPELDDTSSLFATSGVVCGTVAPGGDLFCCSSSDEMTLPRGSPKHDLLGGAGGGQHLCTWDTSGYLNCWGSNFAGQRCVEDTTSTNEFVSTFVGPLAQVGAGFATTYLVEPTEGKLSCCGTNSNSECGLPGTKGASFSSPVEVMSNVLSVGGGWQHACALTRDHEVLCWGAGTKGETGNANTLLSTPTPVVWQP